MLFKLKIRRVLIFTGFILLLGTIAACDSSRVIDEMTSIKNSQWNRLETIPFDVTIKDTTALYNFYVQLRNTTDYPFSNLYLFLLTKDAAGQISKDTIECILAAPDGKWLGKGFGKLKENRILIKKDMRLTAAGLYHLQIEQAMRKDILDGISDIGIRIEKE